MVPAVCALTAALLLAAAASAAGSGQEGTATPFWRSAGIAALAGVTALSLGSALALATGMLRLRGGWLLLGLAVTPLVVPRYLAAVAWVDMVGPAGRIPTLWRAAPTIPSLLAEHWVYAWPSCGLLLGCCLAPLPFLAARAALSRAEPGALEAARLARGTLGELRVALAVIGPQALAGALLAAALAALEFAVPQLLRTRVQTEDVYFLMSQDREPGAALRAAVPLCLLVLALALVALTIWLRRPLPAGPGALPRRPAAWAQVAAWAAASLALLPGLWFPLATLGFRLNEAAGGSAAQILSEAWAAGGGEDAWRSVQVGLGTACVGVVLTVALGWPLRRARGPLAGLVLAALAVAMTIPAPLVGTGLLVGFNGPTLGWFLDSLAVVGLACLLRFFPVAALVVWAALARSPRVAEEAGVLTGRGPLARLAAIGLPSAAPALLAAWLILYVLAVTEYGAGVLVAPPGASILAVFTVNQAHYGPGPVLTGLFVLLLGVVALPFVVWGLGRGVRGLWARWA